MAQEQDNSWYINITRTGPYFYSFVAIGSCFYKDYKRHAEESGLPVVAEQFDVSVEIINRIHGFDESGRRTKENLLFKLVSKLNSGEEIDVQKELTRICSEE